MFIASSITCAIRQCSSYDMDPDEVDSGSESDDDDDVPMPSRKINRHHQYTQYHLLFLPVNIIHGIQNKNVKINN